MTRLPIRRLRRRRAFTSARSAVGRIQQAGRIACILGLAALLMATRTARPDAAGTAALPAASPRDEVLTLAEAAAFLKIDEAMLAALVAEGAVPGRQIGTAWRFSRSALLEWLAGEPTAARDGNPLPRLDEAESDRMRARGAGTVDEPVSESSPTNTDAPGDDRPSDERPKSPADPTPESVGEAPVDRTATDVFLRSRRVVLAPKQMVVEPLVFYTRADTPDLQFVNFDGGGATPIKLTVGQAANIEQNITNASLSTRIGLAQGLEGTMGAIMQDRRLKSVGEPQSVDTELRSVFMGLRRVVVREDRYVPETVIGVQGIGPLGESSPAIGINAFAVKSADPIAFFAGLEYQHTFSHEFKQVRKLEPENTFAAQLGYVFAVSDQTSLSGAIQGLFVLESKFRTATIEAREEFSLRLGVTHRLSATLYVEPSVAFSLNGPGNFVTLGLRFPWITHP